MCACEKAERPTGTRDTWGAPVAHSNLKRLFQAASATSVAIGAHGKTTPTVILQITLDGAAAPAEIVRVARTSDHHDDCNVTLALERPSKPLAACAESQLPLILCIVAQPHLETNRKPHASAQSASLVAQRPRPCPCPCLLALPLAATLATATASAPPLAILSQYCFSSSPRAQPPVRPPRRSPPSWPIRRPGSARSQRHVGRHLDEGAATLFATISPRAVAVEPVGQLLAHDDLSHLIDLTRRAALPSPLEDPSWSSAERCGPRRRCPSASCRSQATGLRRGVGAGKPCSGT